MFSFLPPFLNNRYLHVKVQCHQTWGLCTKAQDPWLKHSILNSSKAIVVKLDGIVPGNHILLSFVQGSFSIFLGFFFFYLGEVVHVWWRNSISGVHGHIYCFLQNVHILYKIQPQVFKRETLSIYSGKNIAQGHIKTCHWSLHWLRCNK